MKTTGTIVEKASRKRTHRICFPIVVAALVVFLSARANADNSRSKVDATAPQTTDSRNLDTAEQKFEAEFLQLLSAGKQSDAEALVVRQLSGYPKLLKVIELVSDGKEKEARDYKLQHLDAILPAQRPLFLWACCLRSRFDKQTAFLLFNVVWMLDHKSPAAQCAYVLLALDSQQLHRASQKEINRVFGVLQKMADNRPDDVMIRWMLAVQCRTWARYEQGVDAYKLVLEKWNPGPALVHQTYANLLDELHRYQEALPERRQVVKMEPASWSYDGLANTLQNLGRYDEACVAHRIATQMDPDRSIYWSNWAVALNGQQRYAEAIAKCQEALELDDNNWRANFMWGKALAGQGNAKLALEKCKLATARVPDCAELNALVAELQTRVRD